MIFIFWHYVSELPIHVHVQGAYFLQMTSSIVVTPKRHFLARKHVVSAIKREHRPNGSTWACAREKMDRTEGRTVKSHKISRVTTLHGVKFPIFLLIVAWALQQCSANALPVMPILCICEKVAKSSHPTYKLARRSPSFVARLPPNLITMYDNSQ